MSYISQTIQLLAKTFLFSIVLTLVACGGGGGGDPDSTVGSTNVVSYSGSTNQATIDSAKAEEIADSYLNSSEQDIGAVAVISTNTNLTLDKNSTDFLIEKLKQNALSSINNSNSLASAISATSTVTPGDCSTYNIDVSNGTSTASITSQSNTAINMQVLFTNYCIYNTTNSSYLILNGLLTASFTGTNLLVSDSSVPIIINNLTMSVLNLDVAYTDGTKTFRVFISQMYSFTFIYDASNNLTETNARIYTDVSYNSLVYRFEVESIIKEDGTPTMSTYRFYHPTYGYVEYVSTLTYGCIDGSADGGTLVITGSSASYEIAPSVNCDGTYTVTLI